MAHDVPIATEEGTHDAGIFRANLYAITNGEEGLADPTDGRVSALDVPGPYIRVSPANYTIVNRESGYPKEMYAGRLREEDRVPVSPTTSAGGRTDLVVFRVENPTTGAWTTLPPDQKPDGPYVFTRVISNVPAGTTDVRDLPGNYSAITLARLDIPPSTATITNAMINPLQGTLANPIPSAAEFFDVFNWGGTFTLPPPPPGSGTRFSNWVTWPSTAQWTVGVPTWATEVAISYEVTCVIYNNTQGGLRPVFNNRPMLGAAFDVNFPMFSGNNLCTFTNGGGMRVTYKTGGKLPVQPNERGTAVPVRIEGRTSDTTITPARGSSIIDQGSIGEISVRFKQSAVSA